MNQSNDVVLNILHELSENQEIGIITNQYKSLHSELKKLKVELNFPAVKDDVGSLITFLIKIRKPQFIFEFGSGFGYSAFFTLIAETNFEKIYLTERRNDLKTHFDNLPWPTQFKERCDYFLGDAFSRLNQIDKIDFLLLDGQKSSYLEFLQKAWDKISPGSFIVIDNAFAKGIFIDSPDKIKSQKLIELFDWIKSKNLNKCFIPFRDGVWVLQK